MRKASTIGLGGALLFVVLILGAALHYITPATDLVDVVGTEVKRFDQTTETGNVETRDTYYIQTRLPETNDPYVYRNEDNWLLFKFDSANLQARANAFERDGDTDLVAVRHYGWRIPFLSMYPNAVRIWEPEADYQPWPWFVTAGIGLFVVGGVLGGIGYAMRRALSRLVGRFRRKGGRHGA